MNNKVSIIVPIYNVESYIAKCVESLVVQTYSNVEILLIDDGSTDSSGMICDSFQKLYSEKIKVIHSENRGLSAARNLGINNSSGDLIGFVDGDDWVEAEMLETLSILMHENNADLSVCGLKYDYDDGKSIVNKTTDYDICNQTSLYYNLINSRNFLGYVCNKLFKRELIGKLRFDEDLYSSEDIDFCAKYATQCSKVAYTESELYHYRQRIGSMTGEFKYSFRKLSVIKAFERLIPIYEEYCPSITFQIKRFLLKQNLNILGRIKLSKFDDQDVKNLITYNIKKWWRPVMSDSRNTISERLNILLTRVMPASTLRIKQFVIKRKYK